MTDKNNEPAPSGASSLFGCGTDGAASGGDRERSADMALDDAMSACRLLMHKLYSWSFSEALAHPLDECLESEECIEATRKMYSLLKDTKSSRER